MKRFFLILAMLLLSTGLFAQGATDGVDDNWFGHDQVEQAGTSWEDFQDRSGRALFTAGPGYVGSSLAYFMNGGGRLQYGLNLDLVTVFDGAQQRLTQAGYTVSQSEQAFLVPLWLSMKVKVTDNPFAKFAPYVITGAGPTLGLKFNDASTFSNIISNVEGELGGGAFLGAGVDFMWMERWAISTDVRYNFVKFNNTLGLSDEYRGVSFSFGFIRAF